MAITISDSLKSKIQEHFDFLITEFDEPCKLIYPKTKQQCSTCGGSGKIFTSGGPVPCQICRGQGFIEIEQTETINLKLIWLNRTQVKELGESDTQNRRISNDIVSVPYGLLETRSFIDTLPKLKRAGHIIVQTPIDGYQHQRYERVSEPISKFSFIQNRYISCIWERNG